MKHTKYALLVIFQLLVTLNCVGQREDYVWLQGYSSFFGLDTNTNKWLGISKMDFNNDTMQVSYDSLGINFSRTSTSYCTPDGNLLFYTNGIHIRNGLDEIVEDSWGMNEGQFIVQFAPSIEQKGYRTTQGIVTLPNPAVLGQYYLLHTYWDTSATLGIYCKRVLETLLDMNGNAGHGKVVYKNKPIVENVIGQEMGVCRHANGRDWWVIVNKRYTNCYYRILVDSDGAHLQPSLACAADSIPYNTLSALSFSPDGSKFAYLSVTSGINIFDFDRCSGELSNALSIPLLGLVDSGWVNVGVAISPNNRFLYVGITQYVLQYDLQAADIAASVDTVAVYDGFQSPFGSIFHTMQLAPDGKIYESCGNSETVYHVINQPDKKGDSCQFVQHGIDLPSYCLGVPNFPNYRLGALPNSPCDTLGTSISQPTTRNPQLTIFPNPATEFVVID
ncbi:MAG: hypothetical protein JNK66_14645, partial [Chitinophagales bacterium]|nr:hypothetical protein [Chitinophagales bacterium]